MAGDRSSMWARGGSSVRELIQMVEEVTGRKVPYEVGPRREGDPASAGGGERMRKLRERLGWAPEYDLRAIVEHAWKFANR